jgi:Ca2+-binding EF-hand superfamily protein
MNRNLLSAALLGLVTAGVALAAAGDAGSHYKVRERHRHPFFAGGSHSQADTNDDGAVDAGEWNALFAKLDSDRNGKLEAEEIHAPPPEALAYFLSREADGDDDGRVTEAEWQARVSALDTDRDGALAPAELSLHFRRRGGREGKAVDSLPPFASRWDANDDDELDSNELAALFTAADSDGDGALIAHRREHRWH